jgi:hypothetical protein
VTARVAVERDLLSTVLRMSGIAGYLSALMSADRGPRAEITNVYKVGQNTTRLRWPATW